MENEVPLKTIKLLQNQIHRVEKASLEWVISGCQNTKGYKDDFMLRVEMLDLKKAIEEILEREPKND
jgi:hypothetical protein